MLPYLRPVLSVSNMSLSTWKLEPEKYCCSMKGLLPYSEVYIQYAIFMCVCVRVHPVQAFMEPQAEVLYHVIAQPNSRDAVHSMLGMSRQVGPLLHAVQCLLYVIVHLQQMQPCAMVEEALVRLAMVAMEMVESVEGREEEGEERVREVWSQLANKLVFFYFLQLINITSVINQLRRRVSLTLSLC